MAHRIAQAPNSYPAWLAPQAPVEVVFGGEYLDAFPEQYVQVQSPPASLCYRVVNPADYATTVSSTNWLERGGKRFSFSFKASVPGATNRWGANPRGTVFLLHGYGISQFAMAPWALRLAQEGWRCVLLDLRGHGKSTGSRIYFGVREAGELAQLADALDSQGQLVQPVAAVGESYGAVVALRWKMRDPRVGRVALIAPYKVLSNAVINVCREYADWFPESLISSGLSHLPDLLGVEGRELNPIDLLSATPINAMFIAGGNDRISTPEDVMQLFDVALPASEFVLVPSATHESLPYHFDELLQPVCDWLAGNLKGSE